VSDTKPTIDLVQAPGNGGVVPGTYRRKFYRIDPAELRSKYRSKMQGHVEVPENDATLVTSELEDGLHAPAIDIDHKVYVVPSSTPGHNHLYIDVKMPWWRYRVMLWGMKVAGVVEPGYYKASVRRGKSFLRRPGVKKTDVLI
jgi:hypothetical protein